MTETKQATYKAIVLSKLGTTVEQGIDGLQLTSLPRRPLKAGEIRLAVHASAVNFFDNLMTIGTYQIKPKLPHTMGSECSGEVIEVGKGVTNFKLGDGVIVGMGGTGSMAEEIVVDAHNCLPKPRSFTHAQAASVSVGFMTAYHGLVHRGALRKGEWLLVTGAGGGMGLAAVQLGKKLGAKVIAAASSKEKLDAARRAGADHLVDYSSKGQLKDRVSEITGGAFADVIFEIVGGRVFDECLRAIAPGGRILLIGFASGSIPQVPANIVLVKGFSVIGVRAGSEMMRQPKIAVEMATKLVQWSEGNTDLAPVVDYAFAAQDFKEAYRLLARREVVGKSCVVWRDGAAGSVPLTKASPRSKL